MSRNSIVRKCTLFLVVAVFCVSALGHSLNGALASIAENPERRQEMEEALQKLETERGLPSNFWSIEEQYEFNQRFPDLYQEGMKVALPNENEIDPLVALNLAVGAVQDKYEETPELSERTYSIHFWEKETGERFFTITFFTYTDHDPEIPSPLYEVRLDAMGELLSVTAGEEGWG